MQLDKLNDQITVLATQRVPSLTAVENIDKEFLRIRLHSLALANSAEPEKRAESRANLETARQELERFRQQYDDLARLSTARELLERFEAVEARYWQAHGRIMRQAEVGDVAGANLASRLELAPLAEQLAELLHRMNGIQHQRIDDTNSETDALFALSRNVIIALLLLALANLYMAALAWLLTRSIVLPLTDAVRVAETIAKGDLTRSVHVNGKDEPARLLTALRNMQQSLQQTVEADRRLFSPAGLHLGRAELGDRRLHPGTAPPE
ncbi:MCP four helix bundle domain-containing protein [Oceanimonas sp. NS1]|nr:MCP four helix bundle domain-containing protein [Oceanimonas sp. NS1]